LIWDAVARVVPLFTEEQLCGGAETMRDLRETPSSGVQAGGHVEIDDSSTEPDQRRDAAEVDNE
jgi:hypothetical protein